MYVPKKVLAIAVGFVLVGAAIAALGLLYMELSQVNADLRQTSAALEGSEQRNAALVEVVEKANAEIVRSNVANTYLNSQVAMGNEIIDSLNQDVAKLNTEVAKGNEIIAGLGETIEDWQVQFNILETTHRTLQDSHAALEGRYDGLKEDLAGSRWELREVRQENVRLETEYGTVQELEAEIARLQGMRQPLILAYNDTERTGFLCTGSMEPKITCLDEMSWLTDYRPEDITVGTTIAFTPDCLSDTPETNFTAHRVVEITVRNGVHYYWPKGDNNLEADGCWVPEHHVNGYLIEIHKNVNMENEHLRRMVNGAYSAMLNATARYLDLVEQVCGVRDIDACPNWRIRQASTQMLEAVLRAYDTADRAWNHYNCWYQNALDSQRPGHIPYSC